MEEVVTLNLTTAGGFCSNDTATEGCPRSVTQKSPESQQIAMVTNNQVTQRPTPGSQARKRENQAKPIQPPHV